MAKRKADDFGAEPKDDKDLVVAKVARAMLKGTDTPHCASCALPALNAKVREILGAASERALKNGRKTVKACDI